MGVKLDLKGIGELVTGAGTLAKDIRSAITGEISPEKKAELEAKTLEIEAAVMQAQMAINQEEAKSASLFVSGWRPAFGWTGVVVFWLQFIIRPLIVWGVLLVAKTKLELPEIDINLLWPLISGILGIAGMRTFEKKLGVDRK